MAQYPKNASIPIAAHPKKKFPLHRGHVTTSTFMRFDVALAKRLIPGSDCKFNHQTLIRTLPLRKPLLTSVQVHNRAIFVPFRVVWEPWTDFITDTPHVNSDGTFLIPNNPFISAKTMLQFLLDSRVSTQEQPDSEYSNVDFRTADDNYYQFTSFGRYAYSLFVQLGQRLPLADLSTYDQVVTVEPLSALPILCLAKAYLDFYFPNAYAHSSLYASVDIILQRQYTYQLSATDLFDIISLIRYVNYNDDYFVNAFDNPIGPNSGVGSTDFTLFDVSLYNQQYSSMIGNVVANLYPNGTPVLSEDGDAESNSVGITDYQLKALHSLTDYVRRHQLAGSRSLERYLAEYGIALTADKLKRCIQLDSNSFPVQVGDVMATADTINADGDGAQLGQYGGKAIAFDGDLNIDFHTDEWGYLFVITTIVPDVGYVQGYSREGLALTKLDYLTHEFDGLATQPISSGELFSGMFRTSSNLKGIFGFTGRYAQDKVIRDCLSGAFLFRSRNRGLLGWEGNRLWSDEPDDVNFNVKHSIDFMRGTDSAQFNRIFTSEDDDEDNFVVVHRDNFALIQPAKSLFDLFDFEEETHKKVTMDINGVKAN